jgi:hypothetical protein
MTRGIGADSVVECVETQDSVMQAIGFAKGHLSYVGVPHEIELNGERLSFSQLK